MRLIASTQENMIKSLIEKNILVPQADKEVHVSFEKDGGDELCAVLKINNFQKKD